MGWTQAIATCARTSRAARRTAGALQQVVAFAKEAYNCHFVAQQAVAGGSPQAGSAEDELEEELEQDSQEATAGLLGDEDAQPLLRAGSRDNTASPAGTGSSNADGVKVEGVKAAISSEKLLDAYRKVVNASSVLQTEVLANKPISLTPLPPVSCTARNRPSLDVVSAVGWRARGGGVRCWKALGGEMLAWLGCLFRGPWGKAHARRGAWGEWTPFALPDAPP